jgi:ankyrin repeat protein
MAAAISPCTSISTGESFYIFRQLESPVDFLKERSSVLKNRWLKLESYHYALCESAKNGKITVVQTIINIAAQMLPPGKKLCEYGDDLGFTPLLWAASKDQWIAVKFLLKNNVDPNVSSSRGTTAVSIAVGRNKVPLVALLLKYGAIVDDTLIQRDVVVKAKKTLEYEIETEARFLQNIVPELLSFDALKIVGAYSLD